MPLGPYRSLLLAVAIVWVGVAAQVIFRYAECVEQVEELFVLERNFGGPLFEATGDWPRLHPELLKCGVWEETVGILGEAAEFLAALGVHFFGDIVF